MDSSKLDAHLCAMEAAIAADDWRAAEGASEEYGILAHGDGATISDTEVQRTRYRAAHDRIEVMGPRRISCTYEIVTPESAEDGDVSERGWKDYIGKPMEGPDSDDEDLSAVANAIAFLHYEGAREASSSCFGSGVWYSTEGDTDYRTGAEERRSFHLSGPWTEAEERAIFVGVAR